MRLFNYIILCIFLSLTPLPSLATQCSVNVNYGIVIDPTHIRMIDHGQTYVQINHDKQLFVYGREITLSKEQALRLNEYAKGIRTQVPEIVSIAIDGVDLGLKSVNKVIGGLTGQNSVYHQKVQQKFDEIKMRIHLKFNHSDTNYYLAPQDFDNFEELFNGEFEQEIDEIISNSLGTILMAVDDAMLTEPNNNELPNEQNANNLSTDEQIQNIGQEIEVVVNTKASALSDKANQFCENMVKLNLIEDELQISVKALVDFNLIDEKL